MRGESFLRMYTYANYAKIQFISSVCRNSRWWRQLVSLRCSIEVVLLVHYANTSLVERECERGIHKLCTICTICKLNTCKICNICQWYIPIDPRFLSWIFALKTLTVWYPSRYQPGRISKKQKMQKMQDILLVERSLLLTIERIARTRVTHYIQVVVSRVELQIGA